MSIPCAVLMCHAPIVVPRVGGSSAARCQRTTDAMAEVARIVVAHRPDAVILLSPHTPREERAWGLLGAEGLRGDFAQFGVPEVRLSTPAAAAQVRSLSEQACARDVSVRVRPAASLDHGAAVPLCFLTAAGLRVPVAVVALPHPAYLDAVAMGELLRDASEAAGERWVVVASGDLSHRVRPGAPAGYHPRARDFDEAFVESLRARRYLDAVGLDPELLALAAEDAVDTTHVALAAVGFRSSGARVVAYEAPFGVGYAEALLFSEPPDLAGIARAAIGAQLRGEACELPLLPEPWDAPLPVFVTLRSPRGELRGCIGRTEPMYDSLAREVADCAVGAATRDARVPPVSAQELPALRIDVSVLSAPEVVADLDQVDPSRHGVVVSARGRRGVLLPNLEGVDSAQQQVSIACRKAGLDPSDERLNVQRFEVCKFPDGST